MISLLNWLLFFTAGASLFCVYIFVILDKILLSWIFLGISFLPTLFWFLKDMRLTPFLMPLAFAFGGGVWGLVVSDSRLSVGIFQTLIASILAYFIIVHFPYKKLLFPLIYSFVGFIVFLFIIFGMGKESSVYMAKGNAFLGEMIPAKNPFPTLPDWFLSPESPTLSSHGLLLLMLILFFIALCISPFTRGWRRIFSCVSGSFLLFLIVSLTGESLIRLINAQSVLSRIDLLSSIGRKLGKIPPSGIGLGELISKYEVVNPHNAYFQLWCELGILGIISAVLFFAAFIWISGRILSSPKKDIWYGFSLGIILSIFSCIVVGMVETSPFGCAVPGMEPWHFVILPLIPILSGTLVGLRDICEDYTGTYIPPVSYKDESSELGNL